MNSCFIYKNLLDLIDLLWTLEFLLPQCTECAYILEDVQSASCDAAALFSKLTQIYNNQFLLKKQLIKFASDYYNFLLPECTECAHILEDVQSVICDAATWFSGLIQIYINTILLKDSCWSLQVIYDDL
jgi:hypothetical protein